MIIPNKYISQTNNESDLALSLAAVQCNYIVTAGYALCPLHRLPEREARYPLSSSHVYIVPSVENQVAREMQTFWGAVLSK